jgi:hypothetical protein
MKTMFTQGLDVSLTVSHRVPEAAAWVKVSPICGRHMVVGLIFSEYFDFPRQSLTLEIGSLPPLSIIQSWYNGLQ